MQHKPRRVVRLGSSRVPCASPEAVIHMALAEAGRGEEILFVAPREMAEEVRKAIQALSEYLVLLDERVEDEAYRVLVRRVA